MSRAKAEQETIVCWDEELQVLHLYTASPFVARRLIGLGYPLEAIPGGWRGIAPLDALQFRPLIRGVAKTCRYCSEIALTPRRARSKTDGSTQTPPTTAGAPQAAVEGVQ
jgi:hypothetical protein